MATRTKVLNAGAGTSNMLWGVSYYDNKGRVALQINQHYKGAGTANPGNYDQIASEYTFTGLLRRSERQHYTGGNLAVTIASDHYYDHLDRPTDTWIQVNQGAKVLTSRKEYNEIGQMTANKLHSASGTTFAQVIQYEYTTRGWLRKTSSPLFTEELRYHEGAYKQYNGNIAYQVFTRKNLSGSNVTQTYGYTYDKLNRLLQGNLPGNKGLEALTYDKMGNIQSLKRSASTSSLVDNLSYSYSGNRLSEIDDAAASSSGVYQLPGLTRFTYDANGNLKTRQNAAHPAKNITATSYNHLNLPRVITAASGNVTYTYDASGKKLRSVGAQAGQTRDYIDGIEYSGGSLEIIHFEQGRIVRSGTSYLYDYLIKDHLGNNRVGFRQSAGPATTPNFSSDYYPFGLQYQAGIRQPSPKNNYLYNDKELQESLMFFDYGARYYDPVIGRWNSMDALTDSVPGWSPYNYGWNNPVKNVDPDGNLAYGPDDWIRNRYGQYLWDASAVDQSSTRANWTYVGKALPADVGRLDILTEIDGRLYHKNTGNLFASIGNNLYGLLGGKGDYFVEHKPYDPVTENALMEGAATGGSMVAGSFVVKGALGLIGRGAAKGGSKLAVQFGKTENQIYHAFRHTDALGLDRSLVQSTIQNHFKTVSSQVVAGKPFNQIIEIGGQRIRYTAFKLSDGTFNIGRIHGIK